MLGIELFDMVAFRVFLTGFGFGFIGCLGTWLVSFGIVDDFMLHDQKLKL